MAFLWTILLLGWVTRVGENRGMKGAAIPVRKAICFRRALLYKIRIFNSPCSSFLSDTFFPLCRSFKFKRLQEMDAAYHRIIE